MYVIYYTWSILNAQIIPHENFDQLLMNVVKSFTI